MIKHENDLLYMQDSIDKQLQISFDGGTITNKEIPSEQFSLTESLSSDGLMFGSCEASEVKFRIYNVFTPLKDKWLTVTQVLDKDFDNPLQIGKYKVYSDKPTADRSYRDVVAYDSMFDIINADVAIWYNSLTFPMQLKTFRDSFFDYFGIDQEEVALVNDAMTIEKTIEPSVLSGKDVLQSICQINGCFGHIGRDGKMQYVFLNAIMGGLYPSNNIYPADDLYPMQANINVLSKGLYVEPPTYEDYMVKPIDKLEIREKEGDIGVIVGSGNNAYVVEDNFLVYGKSTDDLTVIANNMLSVIDGLEYRPFDARLVGNPCFEVGDMVRLNTKHQIIDSYVLQRTLSGVQCLRDDFSAEGEEYQSEKVNDIQTDIKQLKGKSNTLERTVEETRSTIADVEEGLQSEISQTADAIRLEVAEETNELSSQIEQTQSYIVLGVNSQGKMVLVELSADRNTGTAFTVNADNIDLSAEEVINLLSGGTINLSGKNISIDSNNFSVDSQGNMSCNNASVTGDVNATTLNVLEKITMFSKRIFQEGEYIDAIYSKYESDGSTQYLALHSLIEYFDRKIKTKGLVVQSGGSGAIIYGDTYLDGDTVIGAGSLTVAKEVYTYSTINSSGGIYSEKSINSPAVLMGSYACRPVNDYGATSGDSDHRWSDVYSAKSSNNLSDRNLKNNIKPISETYENLFFMMKPVSYMLNAGDRTHWGFISQDLEQSLTDLGLAAEDCAAFCKDVKKKDIKDESGQFIGNEVVLDKDGNPEYVYGIRYGEFISLNTHMIQKAYKKIETQQQEIDTLKEQVSFLMKKLGDDSNG